MFNLSVALAGIIACVSGTALAHTNMSDSGIEGPPYTTILQMMETLAETHPNMAEVVTYGMSVRGRPLRLIKIEDQSMRHISGRSAVLITGATHGNEYLNIADRLPGEFLRRRDSLAGLNSYLTGGGVIYLLPILNPDGYERDDRENANNRDLNRDFPLIPLDRPGFTQPETRYLGEYLERDLMEHSLVLKVSVDYHCCIGALLYPWSYTTRPVPEEDLEAHIRIARKMVEIFGTNYDYGTTYEILGYRPYGTSKDYYYPKYGALTYTYEGKYRVEDRKLESHLNWWDWILADLAANRFVSK